MNGLADFITQFAADEGVSRDNFNSRIAEVNAGLTTVQGAAVAAQAAANAAAANSANAEKLSGRSINDIMTTEETIDWAGVNILSWSLMQTRNIISNCGNLATGFPFTGYWRIELAAVGNWRTLKATNINWSGGVYTNTSYDGLTWTGWIGVASLDSNGKGLPEQASSMVVQKGASFTLSLSDAGKFLWVGHATNPITITVPTNASAAFPVGTEIEIGRGNTGSVMLAGASGVNLMSIDGAKVIGNLFGCVAIKKISADHWLLSGDLG